MKTKTQTGFTLIEVIVSITILVIIGAILFVITYTIINVSLHQRAQTQLNEKTRFALDVMTADFKVITGVYTLPYPWAHSLTASDPCYPGISPTAMTSSSSVVVATVPSLDASNNAIFLAGTSVLQTDIIVYHTRPNGIVGTGGYRLCRAVIPATVPTASLRPATTESLLNNVVDSLGGQNIWSYNPSLAGAIAINTNFTQRYVNERTGKSGFQGATPSILVDKQFRFRK